MSCSCCEMLEEAGDIIACARAHLEANHTRTTAGDVLARLEFRIINACHDHRAAPAKTHEDDRHAVDPATVGTTTAAEAPTLGHVVDTAESALEHLVRARERFALVAAHLAEGIEHVETHHDALEIVAELGQAEALLRGALPGGRSAP